MTKSKNCAHMSEMWRLNISNIQSIQIPAPVHRGPATYSGGSKAGGWRCSIGGRTVYCAFEVITGRRTRSGSIGAPDSDRIVEATEAECRQRSMFLLAVRTIRVLPALVWSFHVPGDAGVALSWGPKVQ